MILSWKEISKIVEKEVNSTELGGQPSELYDPINYILQLGGKRIRPTLCLLSAQMFNGDFKGAMDLAMGVEVFHNFTLVHDDIMDEAPLRRGEKTIHEKWNRDIAILSGDVMFVKAYQYLCRVETPHLKKILDLFNTTAIEVCEGQQLDMNYESEDEINLSQYERMIELKTAVLLACSLKMGAIYSGASKEDSEAIYEFGRCIGIAFQIQDDYLDAYANPEEFGKKVGGDILNDKKTFLMISALEKANFDQKQRLESFKSDLIEENQKIENTLAIFNELNIADSAKERMEYYFDKAMNEINSIQVSDELKEPLLSLAKGLMNRKT